MLKLKRGDKNAGITVVEDPREIVSRLGHLDTDRPELSEALMSLGPNRLRHVANQAQTALARVAPHTVENFPENRELMYETFRRPDDFGD